MNDFLFGFQYYRAPTPFKENWDHDLRKIAQDGFNAVKFWVQWRWNNPVEGEYYFDDLDELMRLADKYGLKVILNLVLDVSPVWIHQKYPDSVMETNSGEKLNPTSTLCRQIGGAPGPCFHHDGAAKAKFKFVEETVKHFKDCPSLHSWDIWNEPELTVAIKRKPDISDLVCYCPNSIQKFRLYLQKKYKTISALNKSWGRNYGSFDDAEAPRTNGTTNDMIDWRLFFLDTLTEDAHERARIVRKYDKAHAVSCHTVPLPLFNSVSCASDDWEIAKACDYFGNSAGSDPFSSRLLASTAGNTPAINSEIHSVYGMTNVNYHRPTMQDLLFQTASPLGNGIKGFLFWQYRPEILGLEAPAWGSVGLNGEDTEWHRCLIDINKYFRSRTDEFLNAPAKSGKVAVFVDKKNEICMWNITGSTTYYDDSVKGAFQMLYDIHQNIDFINAEQICEGMLNGYEIVYFPVLAYASLKLINSIVEWIKNGGTAIFEPQLAIISQEYGVHESVLPGIGLDSVLGISLTKMISSEMIGNAYLDSLHGDKGVFAIRHNGSKGVGCRYICSYQTSNADIGIAAHYEDGMPAAYRCKVGKGSAFVFCSLFSAAYKYGGLENSDLLADLLGIKSDLPTGVRINKIGKILVLENRTDARARISVTGKVVFGVDALEWAESHVIMKPQSIAVLEEMSK